MSDDDYYPYMPDRDEIEWSQLDEVVAMTIGEIELSDTPEPVQQYIDRLRDRGYKYRKQTVIYTLLADRGILSRITEPYDMVYRTPQLNPPII